MDGNTAIVLTEFAKVIKDISLVFVGAGATYIAQRTLFNKQYRNDMEQKEEEIILDAIRFSSSLTDRLLKFQVEKDFKEIAKLMDEGHFIKLKLISFQLRRIQDKKVWELFQKTMETSFNFSELLQHQELTLNSVDILKIGEAKNRWEQAEKSFADHAVAYLKINKHDC